MSNTLKSRQTMSSRSLAGTSSSMRAGGGSFGLGQSRVSVSRSTGYGLGSSLGGGYGMGSSLGAGLGLMSGGGGGGGSFSISSSSFSSSGLGLGSDEKQTMQSLNDRLAVYLEKVRTLEKSNAELELQIREFYQQAGPATRDYSQYWVTISSLREQINDLILTNSGIMLQLDNSKLAAEDFKTKFETELSIRMSVENDINGLRSMLDSLTLERSELESEIENLREELIYIRKNHEEDLANQKSQMSGNVSVDIRDTDSVDLMKILEEIRKKYEAMVNQNKAEVEDWYKEEFTTTQQQMNVNAAAVDGEKSKLTELRRSCQGLETELNTLLSIIASLEGNLDEVDLRYAGQRETLQMTINGLEGELGAIRGKLVSMSEQYTQLLNIKSRLEMEIETYRRLLGGFGNKSSSQSSSQSSSSSTVKKAVVTEERKPVVETKTKTITVVEQVIDGKVVSTHTEESS